MLRVFLLVLLFSQTSFAQEKVLFFKRSGAREFAVKYQEETRNKIIFSIDIFRLVPGDYQERIASYKFDQKLDQEVLWNQLHRYPRLAMQDFMFDTRASTPLWRPKNTWSAEWEEKYNQWVEANFDEEFFVKKNLATDCADAAIMLRWILLEFLLCQWHQP